MMLDTVGYGSTEVALPWKWRHKAELDDGVVLVLRPDTEEEVTTTPDFPPPPAHRNVVHLGPDGDVEWTIDPLPGVGTTDYRHEVLWMVGNRLLTLPSLDEVGFVEVNPATGAVLDTWARTEFKVDDVVVSFGDERVQYVVWYDETYVVQTTSFPEYTDDDEWQKYYLYGIDGDGTQRWRSDTRPWGIRKTDDGVFLHDEPNMGRHVIRRLDVDTGEIEAVDDGPLVDDFFS